MLHHGNSAADNSVALFICNISRERRMRFSDARFDAGSNTNP
jgi:hypothetical protein